jgi:DNA polymerase-3 subunit epsilon
MQHVADVGGQPADSVTKKTDFLVVGGRYFDVFSQKTTKLQRATEVISKGGVLDIIGEDDFLKLLAG